MKKFEFSLHRLLQTRLTLEESAQRRLAHGVRCLRDARNELEQMRECLRRESRRLENLRGRRTDKHELLRMARYRNAAQMRVRRQELQVEKYEDTVGELREQLRVIMVERKSLENLRDIEFCDWQRRQRRQEQKDNDEIAVQRHLRRASSAPQG